MYLTVQKHAVAQQSMYIEPLASELREELRKLCRGDVFFYGDPSFVHHSNVFNGNVVSLAKAAVCPLDAEDVSRVIQFCTKRSLSPSIKAGGYGTGGWAIGGDIIIDLCRIVNADIEPPHPDGSFTSLADIANADRKGKKPVTSVPESTVGRERREADAALRMYDFASLTVANFLHAPLGHPDVGNPPIYDPPLNMGQLSIHSAEEGPENNGPGSPGAPLPATSNADPFGYMDTTPATTSSSSFTMPSRNSLLLSDLPAWQSISQMHTSGRPPLNNPLHSSQLALRVEVEPMYPHAFVTFGAGMRQKEIDTFTAEHKLEARYLTGHGDGIPYHVPFAAHPVGSSNMLLGGFGFLGRLHGLSIDNLVEVEMVLADGRIVIVNENSHSDLWWALRGAGTTFGVAIRYKAKAFPVPVVFAGNLVYRFHKATAPSLIKHYRDCIKSAPRELYANVLLTAGPAGKDSLVVIQMCYIGPKEKGQEFLAAISSWDGEMCLLNEVNEKSFLHQQDSVAQVLRGKAGRQWFIRSALISSLPDEVINDTVMKFADTPVGCTWLFELAGGAITDFEDTCVPKSQRGASFTIAALHQWEMDVDDHRCVESAEEWISETLSRVATGGPFPSFLGRHEPPERTKASFGSNWERVAEIKRRYDPDNLFRNTFWPLNAEGELVDPRTHEPPTPKLKHMEL